MKVGIVGLGLIGGSLARAFSESATVYGCDRDQNTQHFALLSGAICAPLSDAILPECELVLVAVYPQGVIDWVTEHAPLFSKNTVVIDCAGTKQRVCEALFPVAKQYGFSFLGGHPMAGTQYSGFKYSRTDLFFGAPMVIVPPDPDDIRLLSRVKELLYPAGFSKISVTTAQEHDRIIAYTSQLPHVVSNAFIKSPTAQVHAGFSAGSYRDLTRVAWLEPSMWTELFLENRACLLSELSLLQKSLEEYRLALEAGDGETLYALLLSGKQKKEEADGK